MSETTANLHAIAASVTGENFSSSVPTINTLETFSELNKFMSGTGVNDLLKPFVDNELSHLKTAMQLISTKEEIRAKFGVTLGGAMALAEIIKYKTSERRFDTLLSGAIDKASAESVAIGRSSSGTNVVE